METALAEKYAPINEDVLDDPLTRDDFIEIFDENYEKFDFWDVEDLINDIYSKLQNTSPIGQNDDDEEIEEYEKNEPATPYELKTIEDDEDERPQDYIVSESDSPDLSESFAEGEEELPENELLEEVPDKNDEKLETDDLVKQLLIQILF